MAETPSTFELQAGELAPSFQLPYPATNSQLSLEDIAENQAVAVIFACNHCPYVTHLAEKLGAIAQNYQQQIAFVAISSNDVANYPQDAPEHMPAFQQKYGWNFPYLYDESQAVAKAYKAACTPDFFLFDKQHKLFWAGQFDSTRPSSSEKVTGEDLIAAIEALLSNNSAPQPWIAATGCNIKWKQGHAPSYFGA